MIGSLLIFFKLLIGHAVCDYPLQGDFIAKFKSHKIDSPIPGEKIWWQLLTAHSLIHAGAVWAVTGLVWLGIAELICHWWIDWAKSEGISNFHSDQALHVCCKCWWVAIWINFS
jgi:hypothetical protein